MKQFAFKIMMGLAACCATSVGAAQQTFRVMSYNVENLFDCQHDTLKNDVEFLPTAQRKWTVQKYQDKLNKIAKVIYAAGGEFVPDLVGLCEVENPYCLDGLTRYSALREAGYRYLMTDSPDERGIDVALLYQPYTFCPVHTQSLRVPHVEGGKPTRDILHVAGRLVSGDTLDVFVCHFPSRSSGEKQTEPYRMAAAGRVKQAADSVMSVRTSPYLIIMGDFNDYPSNRSLTQVLEAVQPEGTAEPYKLYNLMDGKPGGTYKYRGKWGVLDQLVVSGTLLGEQSSLHTSYDDASIVSFPFLLETDGRYGGDTPFRTYTGPVYHGGFSDHLPVLLKIYMPAM